MYSRRTDCLFYADFRGTVSEGILLQKDSRKPVTVEFTSMLAPGMRIKVYLSGCENILVPDAVKCIIEAAVLSDTIGFYASGRRNMQPDVYYYFSDRSILMETGGVYFFLILKNYKFYEVFFRQLPSLSKKGATVQY